MKKSLITLAALVCALTAGAAQAAIKIAILQELTGPGATAGTTFKDGALLAIKEINASGGILGQQIDATVSDTQSSPSIAKGLATKAADDDVFAVFGPTFSGSMLVSMNETRRAEIPNFTGAEAAAITEQGNPYVFRTSFTQATSMPKVARYMANKLKVKTVSIIIANNDFGKGGLASFQKAIEALGVKVLAVVPSEPGQIDFSAPVLKVRQSNADAVFVYLNEEESAHALRELRKQGFAKPIVGETTLTGQKVIDLAGDAANGALAHVGLSVDAPIPAMRAFSAKFEAAYKYTSDHNGIKGYTGIYMMKAGIEKVGKIDRKALAKALHGMTIQASQQPGVLMDVSIDDKGDIDRQSFIVQVKDRKQVVQEILPPLGKH